MAPMRWSHKLQIILLILIAFLFAAPASWAATYYIDATTGIDSNDGLSPTNAWKTIAKVNASSFSPGDQVLFKRGEIWRETLVVPSSGRGEYPITFSAYGTGANPIISGADIISSWVTDGATNVWNAAVTIRPYLVVVNNTMGVLGASKATLAANNQWFWNSNALSLYSTTDPNGTRVVESGARTAAIYGNAKDYVTIDGFNIKGTNGRSIRNNHGDYWTIKNNIVELTSAGTSGDGSGSIVTSDSTGTIITGNTIRDTLNDGIYLWNPTNHTVSSNTLLKNNGSDSDSIQLTGGTNNTIAGNRCDQSTAASSGKGNIISLTGTGNIIQNNILVGGLYAVTTDDNNLIVRYNTSAGHTATNSWAFGISNETNAPNNQEWYYNISYGDKNGFYGPTGPMTNMVIYNNVVYNATTTAFDIGCAVGSFSGHVVNNIFYNGASSLLFNIGKPGSVISDYNLIGPDGANKIFFNGTYYSSLSDYKARTGQDTHSINSDPLFVNTGIDFRLQPSSSCIDAGTDIHLTNDIAGNPVPQGTAVDIGAYEYKKSIPSAPTNLMIDK